MLDKTNLKLLPYELMQLYRHRAGWTQLHLAQELGLSSKRMVQYWEAGTYLPKVESLKKVIAVLVKHHIFLGGQELQEAHQLWKAVKEASDTLLESLTPYPVFDEGWFEALLADQVGNKSHLPISPEVAPLKQFHHPPHNLPVQLTSFIGREPEIAEIKQLLMTRRLLTLSGVGGSGKTRLALAVAEQVLSQFPDGVYFVGLENVTERTTLISSLAQTLAVKESATQDLLISLKNYLKERQLLLVLDNFEQLVGQGATLLPELLKSASGLKILVTSRERLQLSEEKECTVEPLALPQSSKVVPTLESLAQYTAVRLFVERAASAKADFSLTGENAAAVSEICQKLDGLPLAIELAAARIKLLRPAQLLQRLTSYKLKVLIGGARDLPPRQQTLHGAIDWSYELLEPAEQQLFRRLAIFAGGCTLDSAEAVCNSEGDLGLEVLEGLEALVNKSLLRQHEDVSGEMRFRMLPTIREYGLDKLNSLAEFEEVEKAYLSYFVNLAEKLEHRLRKAKEINALKELDSEYENLREGLYWTIAQPLTGLALQLGAALGRYWQVRGYFSEGRQYLERILALTGNDQTKAYRIKALFWISWLATLQGDFQIAKGYAEESLALGREISDKLEVATILSTLGMIVVNQGDYAQAQSYFEEARSLERGSDNLDDRVRQNFLLGLGLTALEQEEYAYAQSYFEENLMLGRETEDKRRIAFSLSYLGWGASRQGKYAQAQNYLEEGLAQARELRDRWVITLSLLGLGMVATNQGDYSKAQGYLKESLSLARELGDKRGISYALAGTIFLIGKQDNRSKDNSNQAHSKHLQWIACLSGATAQLLSTLKMVLIQPHRNYYEQGLKAAREALGEEAFAAAFAEGQVMSIDEVTRFTLAIKLTE